jgi:hypothetical protein
MKAVSTEPGGHRLVNRIGRARRVLQLCVLPAVIVLGLVAMVIAFAPDPSLAGSQRVSSASIALGASHASSPATYGVNTLPMADAKTRAAGTESSNAVAAAALAAREHQFHVDHLAHMRRLAAQAAAAAAAQAAAARAAANRPVIHTVTFAPAPTTTYPGDYSCSALESLWKSAGGSPGEAFMAAEIATAESGGNPAAISPTDDYGLWQINASNAPGPEMLNPYANVREAIFLSDDGANWDPWTTYTSGAYEGRC